MSRPPIGSIAVFGGGLVALSAALGFARALPGVTVTLVRTAIDPAALADRLPGTLPAIGDLAPFGVDEAWLVRRGAATHRVGQRFDDWCGAGGHWIGGFGATGMALAGAAFHQHWLDARRGGRIAPFHRFSPAGVLAEAGCFVHPVDDAGSPLSRFAYALRLDPVRAVAVLLDIAQRGGVRTGTGTILHVGRDASGNVARVLIDGDRALTADLFVDCTGPAASLGGAARFEDWADALPCDRLLLAEVPIEAPSPTDHYASTAIGWRARWPLRDRALAGLAYNAAITSESRARRVFGHGGDAAEAIAFRPGRRAAAWHGNVLALGDAAVVTDPLGWTGLALAHAGIALALELLPGRDFHPLEIAEYNRRTALRHARVRDFQALHYTGHRSDGAFRRARHGRPVPAGLTATLAQFAQRGTLPHHEEDSFDKESWIAALIGMGVMPRRRDPVAMSADPAIVADAMAGIERSLAALPQHLPAYADYLAGMARAA